MQKTKQIVNPSLGITRIFNIFLDGLLRIKANEILNPGEAIVPRENPAQALGKLAKELTAEGFDSTGKYMNYKKLAGSEIYKRFKHFTLGLPNCKPKDLGDRQQQIAFWINLYNALVVDAVIQYKLEGSLLSKPSLFRRAAYNVAGFRFSADDIEHGVLRGNQPSPLFPIRAFGGSDPRCVTVIQPMDPRIHFALVCAARSCPPISHYEADQLEQQLQQAAGSFINGGGVRLEKNAVWISKIFKWYQADFGGLDGVKEIIGKFSKDENVRQALRSENLKLKYSPYDWTINHLD